MKPNAGKSARVPLLGRLRVRTWMLEKRLDKVYVCAECGCAFLFHADTEDHDRLSGHVEFLTVPLEIDLPSFRK